MPGYVTAPQQTVLTSNWASFIVFAKRFKTYFDNALTLSFFFQSLHKVYARCVSRVQLQDLRMLRFFYQQMHLLFNI